MHHVHNAVRRRAAICLTLSAAALASALTTAITNVAAQSYPTKPLTIVVGNFPGSAADILVRQLGEELKTALKQNIVVLNRTGANGAIAVDAVKRARADGYTLMFSTMTTLAVNPHLQADARYNAAEDFEPVARHVMQPMLWVAEKAAPYRSLKEVIEFARKNPDKLLVARLGYGGSSHLVAAALMAQQNIRFTIVGLQTTSQAYIALRRGDVQLMVDTAQPMLPRIQAGEVTPLAVTSATRIKALPEVPTWLEQGGADAELTAWYAWLAPKGTPKEIVELLNAEINRLLLTPRIRQPLEEVGGIVQPLNPEETRRYLRDEHARWGRVVKAANLQAE